MRVTEGELGKDREGGLCAQRADTPPKYLSTYQHRQTCAKRYQLTAHGPYLAHRSFAFSCFWPVFFFFFFFFEAVANI